MQQGQVRGPGQRQGYIGPHDRHHRHGFGHRYLHDDDDGSWISPYWFWGCVVCVVIIGLLIVIGFGIWIWVEGKMADPDDWTRIGRGIALVTIPLVIFLITCCGIFFYAQWRGSHHAFHESGTMGPGTVRVNSSMGRQQQPRYFINRGGPHQYPRRNYV